MERTVLTAHNFNAWFGTNQVLKNINVDIYKNKITAVMGPSGCGKTTFIRFINRMHELTPGAAVSGKIFIHDEDIYNMYPILLRRKVGMVFQSFNLISHYTAQQNVETALFFDNTPRRERTKLATTILNQLGLSDRLTHRPADLSGGEQQRVAIARAIVKKPEILFADEPTGNLDHDNAQQIIQLLTDLNRAGLTIVLVTHNLEMARQYTRRIIRMNYGKIVDGVSGGATP